VHRTRLVLVALGVVGASVAAPSAAFAAPGDVAYSCSGVPDGWVVIQNYVGGCRAIEQVAGFPVGTNLPVCEGSPLPAGWTIVYSGFTKSGCNPNPNSAGYGWQIRRAS
jgi:hypothetical protein